MLNPGQMASQAGYRAALAGAGLNALRQRDGRPTATPAPGNRSGLRSIGKLLVCAVFVAGAVLNVVAWPAYLH